MRCVLPPEQLNHVLPETFWKEHVCSCSWQGGGIYVDGEASLTNTNVYSNEAPYVCSPSSLA